MDAVSMMILISIGNIVAWVAAMRDSSAERMLLLNVIMCCLGAFAGGALAVWLTPPGLMRIPLIFLGFLGALAALRLARRLFRKAED